MSISTFGCNAAAIKTKATSNWVHLPSVQTVSFKPNVNEVVHQIDGVVKGKYYHSLSGQLTINTSAADFNALTALLGNVRIDSTNKTIYFGTTGELELGNFAFKCLMRAREAGVNKWLVVYWYQLQLKSAYDSFPSPNFGQINQLTLTFDVFPSSTDENNNLNNPSNIGSIMGRMELLEQKPAWP
jgi:hypothetical protein